MNLQRTLLTSWLAAGRARCWLAGVIYLGSVVGAPLWMYFIDHGHGWMAIRVLTIGTILASSIFLSAAAVPARAAHHSHWPGVERDAVIGSWIYAVPGVAVPGIVIGSLWPVLAALTVAMCAFGVSVGLIFMLARKPFRNSGALVIVLLINPGLDLTSAYATPWFAVAVAGAALITTVIAVMLWRRMVRSETWDCPLTTSSSALAARRQRMSRSNRDWSVWNTVVNTLLRPHDKWRGRLIARIDLVRTGPRWPVRSIRVALGGFNLPASMGANLAFAAWVGLSVTAVVVFVVVAHAYLLPGLAQRVDHVIGIAALVLTELGCLIMACKVVGAPWRRPADLALLALLPGLGRPEHARQHLLRAMIGSSLMFIAGLWVAMLILARWLQLDWHGDLLVTLLAVGCAGTAASYVLHAMSGFTHRRQMGWMALWFVLLVIGSIVPTTMALWGAQATIFVCMLTAAWLLFYMILATAGWRGWQRYRRQSHPFLPSTRQTY